MSILGCLRLNIYVYISFTEKYNCAHVDIFLKIEAKATSKSNLTENFHCQYGFFLL